MELIENALTTLDVIKDELGINDVNSDDRLIRLINSASSYFINKVGRELRYQEITEHLKGTNSQYFILNNYPIVDVSKILFNGNELDRDSWELEVRDKNIGHIYKDDGWYNLITSYGLVGDATVSHRAYDITYTFGYVLPKDETPINPRTLPYDIEDCIIDMVLDKYTKLTRKSYGLKALKQGKKSYTFDNSSIKEEVDKVIDRYKSITI